MTYSSTIDLSQAERMLAAMVGESVWSSRTGHDAILRLDFGSPHLQVREPSPTATRLSGAARSAVERRIVVPTGQWHQFIDSGFWTIEIKSLSCGKHDAESTDATRLALVTKCLALLDGQIVTGVSWERATRDLRLTFDVGGTVSIKAGLPDDEPREPADSDWIVFFDNGSHLSCVDQTFVLETMRANTA